MKKPKTTRLELCLKILDSIEKQKTADLAAIKEKISVDPSLVEKAMCFLELHNMIKKESTKDQTIYTTTPRGYRVNRFISERSQVPTEKLTFMLPNQQTCMSMQYQRQPFPSPNWNN